MAAITSALRCARPESTTITNCGPTCTVMFGARAGNHVNIPLHVQHFDFSVAACLILLRGNPARPHPENESDKRERHRQSLRAISTEFIHCFVSLGSGSFGGAGIFAIFS